MRPRPCRRWKHIWQSRANCRALGGKCVPEFASGMGCSFPMESHAENASQNGGPNWDALSAIEDMRLRISCSAYAYACCQVSTSSLAAAWGSSALQTALTTKKPSTPVALSCGRSAFLTPPPTTMGTGLASWSAARSSKLLVMMEPSAARPQSRLVSVS